MGRNRDGRGAKRGMEGAARGAVEATATTASIDSRRGGGTEDLPGSKQNDGAGGKYCVGGTVTEESAAESAKWSR